MSSQDRFFRFILISFLFMLLGMWLIFFFEPPKKISKTNYSVETEFTELKNDTNVPQVIDNSAIEELDQLMKEIDSTSESIDDLEL